MTTTLQSYIGGAFRPTAGELIDDLNPSDASDVVARIPSGNADDVAAAVRAASQAFAAWRDLAGPARAELLHRWGDVIAGRAEDLAQAMVRAPAALRAGVLDQAAQAWLLDGNPARAYAAATSALNLKPDDPDLLVDRAEAAGAAGWFGKAVADLDRVLKADPARADALIYRASAYRAEGRLDPALTDIDRALKLAPQSAAALLERGNIRRLKGDIDGARGDWTQAAARAPGSAAASDAKDNLARLHSEKKSGPAAAVRPAGSK